MLTVLGFDDDAGCSSGRGRGSSTERLAGNLRDLGRSESGAAVFLVPFAILVAQGVFSTLWLTRFRRGPLEWLWRWATW
ncbi:DUF418 domain-containing protein [Pengzhenrongella sicca]|uniref:DUF418 domain-containing protein n=1 Tax=Pengzhenrongella sicca TaxID=2819238 RepID=A0A8A4ZI67_9MICO|nr:DUF418 domain-containing protein [Pengzhenrongella sicca]